MQPREVEFYVWGAGYAAKEFLYALNEIEEENENVSFVCKGLVDSNEKRWDTEFIGYKVLKPEVVYESSIIPVIIPLENKNEKLIRNNLLMKGYVYKENVWKASDFLAKCLKDSVANAGDEVNIYERVVKKLFTHKTSTENRSYLYAHILVDYLQALLQNGSDVTDVIMCAKQITWEIIEDEVLSIFFLSNNKLFFDSSMDLRRKKQWNDNKQILKKYIADKYLENVSPKADYLKLDNTLYLVVDGQSMYFVDNLMSRDTCLFFCQLDENKNKGLLSFVVQDIKQKAADTIYQKVLMSDASILEYDVKEIYNLVPDSEKYEYLMSREAFYKGDYETAQKYADYGLKKRQFSEKLCLLQGDIFFCQGRYLEAIKYYARTMLKNATREQMWMILSNGELNADENVRESIKKCIECFAGNDKVMIQQCTDILYKELVVYRAKFKEKGIAYQNGKFIIENNEEKKIAYEIREKQKKFFKGEQKKQIFEYFEGDLYLDYELKTAGKTYILPIKRVFDSAIRIEYKNNIISYQGECDETMIVGRTTERFPKNQWVTIRITDDIHIFSEGVFVVGKPIAIGAVEKKPKIVINLFIDALAYARVKDKMDEYMPYTKSFFEKGIIFNECYSVGNGHKHHIHLCLWD